MTDDKTPKALTEAGAKLHAMLAEMNERQDALDRRAAETIARHRAQAQSFQEFVRRLRDGVPERAVRPRFEETAALSENGSSEFDDPLRRGGRSNDNAGGAPVPLAPINPRPTRRGGAARTFAEMDEPPRDP